jgi:hypothetical protein
MEKDTGIVSYGTRGVERREHTETKADGGADPVESVLDAHAVEDEGERHGDQAG